MKKINFFRSGESRQSNDGQSQGHYTLGLTKFLFTLITLLTLGVGQMWANGGIGYKGVKFTKNGSATGWYNIHNVSWDYSNASYECRSGQTGVTDFNNASLGTVTTLKLKAFVVIGWTDNSDYVAGQLKYRLYKQDASAPSYSTYNVGNYGNNTWGATDVLVSSGNNRVVGQASITTDIVTSSTAAGNYYLQVQGMGRMQYTGGGGGSFNDNNGSAVKATLTVPGFTTTSTSNAFGSVAVGSNSSTTISFTQHYGTALTTSNCSLTNSTDFEVTAISETGVTVKYKPQTAGDKSCTLTITDANSKTCTISLTGTTPAGLTVVAGTGISAVTGSDNDISVGDNIAITATVATGYTWDRWTLSGSGTLSTYTATTKNQTVVVGTAANMTLTASATENTHNVTVQYKCSTATIKASTTKNNVGEANATTQAAPAIDGYTFSTWTIESGITKTSGNLTDNTLNFKTNASGTYTITANYTAKSCNLVKLSSGRDGSETTTGTDAGAMTFDPTTKAYYIDITTTASPYYFRFTYNSSTKYCSDWKDSNYDKGKEVAANTEGSKVACDQSVGGWTNKPAMYYPGATGSKLRVWFDYQNKKVWTIASLNEQYVLRGSTYADDATLGGMPGWSATTSFFDGLASGNTGTITATLSASTKYKFKLMDMFTGTWYGKSSSGEQEVADGTKYDIGSGDNFYFTSTIAGTYTFTVDKTSGTKVKVDFPVSYQLNYSIGTVKGNDGDISCATASGSYVGSGNSVTLTAPEAATGYTWKGWYTNAAGTTGKIDDDEGEITVTMNANKTLYACYTENQYNVAVSAGAGGSVSPTGTVAVKQVNGTSLTATPSAGYSFTNWTISGGGITPTTSSTSPQTFKATTTGGSIQANFSEIMRTVTVAVNNSYLGSVSTTSLSSVGPVTKSAEVTATAETGASFSSWTLPSGVTVAAGYTTSSNPIKVNATAADKTITANFAETTYTVTLATADASKGTVGSSPSVGQITAVQITATPKSGYMFSKWVKTSGSGTVTYYTGPGNGQVTDASGEEKETTYICVTGAVTLQATWEPDRSSGYVVYYGNDGKNADGGTDASQTRAWKDGKLYRPTTAASDVSYFTFTAGVGDVDKVIEFKIHKKTSPEAWYGYNSASGGKITGNISNVTLNTSYGNGRLCITMPGSYIFTWNKSNNQLSISYPTDVYYVRGGFDSWGWSHPMTETSSGVYSATVNMTEANHTYSGDNGFKLLIAGQYYGKNSTTVTRSTSTGSAAISSCSTSGANIGITTDYTGNYTFTYTVASNTLQVTYPTAYKVTYGKGTVNGSASNCSAVDIDNSSAAVASNSTWVRDGHRVVLTAPGAKSGYRYLGWYDNNSATGAAITTNANCTITVNSALTRYACYAENLSSITVSAGVGGTVSKGSGTHSLGVTTGVAIDATPSTGYSWSTWTTSGNADLGTTASTKSNTAKGNGTNGGSGTITATFTPNHYDVILDVNGGSGANQTVDATFAAAMPATVKSGSAIAARTKTGYNFDGYWTNTNGTGTQYYTSALASNHNWDVATNNTHIYAKWNAKQSAITFNYQTGAAGYSSSGNITNASGLKGTYDAAMTALTGTMPSAANGYAFTGFYDATSGGTKYYNADGTSAHTWDKDTQSGTTLYARWEKAEVAEITFSPGAVVENNSTVSVTATISPTPTGTTCVCWRVLYDNGSALDPQPTFTPASAQGTSVSFTAPNASGMYKVEAKLSTGGTCGAGTLLDTKTADFQVAGSHTVTVAYKHSGTTIAASTSVTGRPLDWSDPITAPEIFGYTFDHWTAGDGITLSANGSTPVGSDESSANPIYITAIYNGTLTANYTPKSLIYFKNTLGWENVYVNFYKSDYWNDSKGSGNNSVPVQNKAMTRLGETDIWYYDYGSDNFTGYTNTKPTNYVSFTSISQTNAENFWASGTGISASYPARRADDLADKSGETGFYESTPMFVPLAGQTAITKNESGGGKALYYNSGYWTKYLPGTGYTLEFYNNGSGAFIKSMDFTSADELMPMKAVADLEGNTTYKFQIKRHGDVYLGNSGTMTYSNHGQTTPWEMTNTDFSMCRITTTAAGDYTFNFTYSANASNAYRLRLSVDYPVANGDYRLVYNDDTRSGGKPSAIIQKENNGSAIVSFFVRKDQHPKLYMQQASVDGAGNITWREYPTTGTPTNQITGDIASAITKDTVYNFNLSMNGSGALSVTSAEYYSGNFYIRTDAANSKWDNYRTDPDHLMTYSEYLKSDVGYSHYYTHWVNKDDVGRKNVKFVIANDYSPCISDTLAREAATGTWANIDEFMYEGGDLKRSANVRFMWDIKTNNIARAYIDGAQGPGSNFYLLLLSNDSKIKQGETTKTEVSFADNGNWIYEANVKAQPNAQIKLKSTWGEGTTIVQYFKGSASETETLIGGSGTTWYDIRLLYDFKTNRLVAAYVPATGTISTDNPINADVMFIREHQGDVAQLTFTGSGAISDIKTAYGVLRLNKWTINNKSKSTGHAPLSPELSRFERDMFYISFPFRVNLEEVFGFGTYGTHWIIEEYDGAGRAANGFWADTPTFWRFITNRKGKFLEPNTGYIVAIDLDKLGESSSVWANTDQVELFFPSYENLPNITSSSVTYELEAHTCTIGPRFPGGDDRRIKDSHWNVMSVPTYINTDDVTFANSTWITAGDGQLGPNFLYTWNMNDNTLSATSGVGYKYKAMHAYIVQYCGNVTWTTSVSPALAPRRNPKAQKDVEFRIELKQNEEMIDRTFVRLSNDEAVTNGFEFNYDLSKEFNKNKANIYTMVTTIMEDGPSVTETAGNCLPMTEQTIVVPMGVMIAKTGEYTISIPSGTSGIGVTLIDNETGIRTNLALEDYTVALEAGTQNDRFYLEISPITHVATDIENTEVGNQNSDVRKVMVDGILYIIKDGKVFSTQGARVK